jgi:hypothetical protein
LAVEPTVRLYTVRTLEVVRHTLRRINPTSSRKRRRSVAQDMTKLAPRQVMLAPTLVELVVKLTPKLIEPSVVVVGCASPNGAGVILVCDLVALVSIRAVSHTMSRGHKLRVLDDHLATMLITMPFRANTRVFCEEEDVHGYIVAGDLAMSSVYSRLTDLLTEAPFVDREGNRVTVRVTDIARKLADKPHTSRPRLQKALKKIDKTIAKIDGRRGGRRRTLTKDGSDFEVIP